MHRYSRDADWDYISRCAAAAPGLPLIGNGDVYNWEEYAARVSGAGVATAMIARSALIKALDLHRDQGELRLLADFRLSLHAKTGVGMVRKTCSTCSLHSAQRPWAVAPLTSPALRLLLRSLDRQRTSLEQASAEVHHVMAVSPMGWATTHSTAEGWLGDVRRV